MNTQNISLLLIFYGFSNIAGLLILWAAFRRPKLARLALVMMFGSAAWVNYSAAQESPEMYLSYSRYAIKWYADFISGWFQTHITLMISLIAIGQGVIALGMIYSGIWMKIACLGVIVFLIAIAPLGFGAAFPFPLTVAFAAWKIIRKDDGAPLWSRGAFFPE